MTNIFTQKEIYPSRSRTALVVSANGEIRADWARCFEARGMRTLGCAGPQVSCALLDGRARCPLHGNADLVVYDRDSVTPELTLKLVRTSGTVPIAFADDRIGERGTHEPVIAAFASLARDIGCFGLPLDKRAS